MPIIRTLYPALTKLSASFSTRISGATVLKTNIHTFSVIAIIHRIQEGKSVYKSQDYRKRKKSVTEGHFIESYCFLYRTVSIQVVLFSSLVLQ